MLKRMSIQQFRGFYTKQVFNFARPNGKNGSGLTIVVGPNNSGKTTFIEALTFHHDSGNAKRINDSERHGARNPVITYVTDKGTERITNVNNGSQITNGGNRLDDLKIEVVASRRWWQAQYSGTMDDLTYVNQSAVSSARNAGDIGTAQLIATINLDATRRDKLTALMKKMVPNFNFWTVGTREPAGDYLKYRTGNNVEHAVDMLGDGIISLFRIAAQLSSNSTRDYVLVIDEPELSLHPTAQKSLHKVLSEESKDKQIILITHSPYFVNWEDISAGAEVIRLNKHKDKYCTVSQLKPTSNYSRIIGNSIADWQKPEFLDTVSKEIMFANNILFVEGKEDVGLLKRWLVDNSVEQNFEIFGYGIGGETNMPFFLELAEDLGLAKVSALFDNNATKYNQCKREHPSYFVKKLPTDDIRDKLNEDGTLKIEGVFDSSGNIKQQFETQFKNIINDINDYFAS